MSANKKCFVIFPFKKPYESQYEKIYKPALQAAGLKVVRAGGPGVGIITKDIEKKIKESFICFADLTEENANVWYEVGYAYACGKKVVMVCNTDERPLDKLPFDIRGRNIIGYSKAILKNKKTHLSFMADVTEDAKAKMKNAQQKNPFGKIIYDNLTKNDIDVLKEIVNYNLKNQEEGISEHELFRKVGGPAGFSNAISNLLENCYIKKMDAPRFYVNTNSSKEMVLSIFPTDKAMKLSEEKPNLFLDDAN